MSIDAAELNSLPIAEKMRLVKLLWYQISDCNEPIPTPDWALREAIRRRDEMIADRILGLTHDEIWRRIGKRGRSLVPNR